MSPYASAAGNQYMQQSAMTASPGELTLMLYDGCIKNLRLAKIHIEAKDYAKANDTMQKAQGIIAELMRSLDMRYEIAKQLMPLYDFIVNLIVQANVKKDTEKIDEALGFVDELREAWQQAVRINRQQTMGGGDGLRAYG